MTSLDVSGCTSLERLDCQSNALTSLDVSGCTSLQWVYAGKNRMPLDTIYSFLSRRPAKVKFSLSPQYGDGINLRCGEIGDISSYLGDIAGSATTAELGRYGYSESVPDSLYDVTDGRLCVYEHGGYHLQLTNGAVRDDIGLVKFLSYLYVRDANLGFARVSHLNVSGFQMGSTLDDLRISQGSGLRYLYAGFNRIPLSSLAGWLARRPETAGFQLNPQSASVSLELD